jgi:hypothetical protein
MGMGTVTGAGVPASGVLGAGPGLVSWFDLMVWVPTVLALLLVIGWYLSYSASRLDRLHHRVESSRAALDAQLARRAAAALEAAPSLDPATGLLLTEAAVEALAAAEEGQPSIAVLEEVENDLTRALLAAFGDSDDVLALRTDPVMSEVLDVLGQICLRTQLARRFHNDAVAQAQRMRDKRVVRLARLAGYADRPQMIEMDDTSPPGLVRTASR